MAGRPLRRAREKGYWEPNRALVEQRVDLAGRLLDRAKAWIKEQPQGMVRTLMIELVVELELFYQFSMPPDDISARDVSRMIKADLTRFAVAINRRMIHIALNAEDPRVAAQAGQALLDRQIGRATDLPQTEADQNMAGEVDTSFLLPEELAALDHHLAEADRLIGIARERKTGQIEGD